MDQTDTCSNVRTYCQQFKPAYLFFQKRDKNCKVSDVEYNFPSRISLHFQYSENQPVTIFDINVM